MEHIFIREINKRRLAVGFHHKGDLATGLSEVIEESRSDKDAIGVYEANVIIRVVIAFPHFYYEEEGNPIVVFHTINDIGTVTCNKYVHKFDLDCMSAR